MMVLVSFEPERRPASCEAGHLHVAPALTSDRDELLSHLFPALRGLRHVAPSARMHATEVTRARPSVSTFAAPPRFPVTCCAPSQPPGGYRTVTPCSYAGRSQLDRKAFLSSCFSKDRPSVAPESPSPLPVRHPCLRRSVAPSPVGCYTSRLFRPCGLSPLRRFSPRRSCPHCCSGSRPWGSSSFHRGLDPTLSGRRASADSRDAHLPFEAFPPPMAVVAVARAFARAPAGRLSPPARPSPCSAAPPRARVSPLALMCLEAHLHRRPARCRAGPLRRHPKRSRAPKVHQPPSHLAVRSCLACLSAGSTRPRASRVFSIVGSVARPPFPAGRARCSHGLGLSVCESWTVPVKARSRARGGESVRQRRSFDPPFGFDRSAFAGVVVDLSKRRANPFERTEAENLHIRWERVFPPELRGFACVQVLDVYRLESAGITLPAVHAAAGPPRRGSRGARAASALPRCGAVARRPRRGPHAHAERARSGRRTDASPCIS